MASTSTFESSGPAPSSTSTKRKLATVQFNPQEHLVAEMPEVVMMKDIGYSPNTGVSPVAVSQPFKLFSDAAVHQIRQECLSEEVYNKHRFESNLAPCQLRGYVSELAPFIYDAWNHPETLAHISKIAGVDLVPNMNYEIGHVNLSVKTAKQANDELKALEAKGNEDDDKPIVGWHNDSYPFVCVLMLSDCTGMVGGETAVRKANGEVIRVRGPGMGNAVILQGRYLTHQALRALGAKERITMVTSFRPKSPYLPDDTVLNTVRGISDLNDLYYEFSTYRLEIMEARIRAQLARLRAARTAGKPTDTKAIKAFLTESEAFLAHTNAEMVPNEQVIAGTLPTMDFADVDIRQRAKL